VYRSEQGPQLRAKGMDSHRWPQYSRKCKLGNIVFEMMELRKDLCFHVCRLYNWKVEDDKT